MKNSAGATENGTDVSHGSDGVKPKSRKRQRRSLQKTKSKSESVSSPKTINGTENLDETPPSNPNGSLSVDQKDVAPTKMNAFQFMMNSRHKSIGRNSPGRELDLNESADSALAKQELKARKSRFENWAEQKGASKRKRDYEEVGKCIDYKLAKREKKLKKMLKIDCQSDDEVIVKRKRQCGVVDTDSENEETIGDTKKNEKIKKKAKVENGTSKTVKSWKCKIKLNMDTNGEKDKVDEDDSSSPSEIKMSENGTMETINESNTSDILNACKVDDQTVTIETNIVIESDVVTTDQSEEKQDDGRRVLRTRKPTSKMYEDYVILESDDEGKTKNKKRNVKMAPVFLKAAPKPKLDPEVIEARRQFLMSGVPSSLKKEMERQQCLEEINFDVFPAISHVQQLSSNNFWDLPKPELKLTNDVSPKIEIGHFSTDLLKLETSKQITREATVPTKLKLCKKLIHEIKSQNPDYPVYKIFNSINGRSGCRTEKPDEKPKTPKRRGRPKKNQSTSSEPESPAPMKSNTHTLWTEKYKPKSSGDIIGNLKSVSSLRDWLSYWQKNGVWKKQQNDSESEFDLTDSDSRDSSKLLCNTVILKGPPGSGKTAAVYAVCNELGYDVIEVNASSKRTGKKLLQELQEATRSHQVKKENALSSFVKEKMEEKPKRKMCALLIEDVDLVFDQDEGFAAALSQIITTSKRPVILTATEEASPPVQKIIDDFRLIVFSPLSGILSIWLQIVCLVEGYYVDKKHLEELLNYNNGDIRRTLLQLQFFVSSGGRVKDSKVKRLIEIDDASCIKMEDDHSNMADESNDQGNIQVHCDCLTGCLPRYIDLGKIWWNLPNILNLPNLTNLRLKRQEQTTSRKKLDKQKLEALFNCYDSLSFADVISGRDQYHESLERRFRVKASDGLGLEENMSSYQDEDVSRDLGYSLLDGTINIYRKKFKDDCLEVKMAVPVLTEQRWRSKQLTCEDRLQGALLPGDFLERKAFCVDYMPYLRTIARSESERAARNTKRGNRFYNYLRNLGVHCGETSYRLVCETFKIIDSSL